MWIPLVWLFAPPSVFICSPSKIQVLVQVVKVWLIFAPIALIYVPAPAVLSVWLILRTLLVVLAFDEFVSCVAEKLIRLGVLLLPAVSIVAPVTLIAAPVTLFVIPVPM